MKTATSRNSSSPSSGGFMRNMAGGFMGGALGSMLFGGMGGGMGGSGTGGGGIGLFQILILGGIIYFVYTRFFRKQPEQYRTASREPAQFMSTPGPFATPSKQGTERIDDGLAWIQESDSSFDPEQFKESAQDVFFQVQAGWMRRDLSSYRHLLGDELATQYENQLSELKQKGHINKLENIAVRSVEIVDAGTQGNEEFVTISFKANLLDYTVDERSNAFIEGSMTEPVKFSERWSWARPIGSTNWLLAGIEIA